SMPPFFGHFQEPQGPSSTSVVTAYSSTDSKGGNCSCWDLAVSVSSATVTFPTPYDTPTNPLTSQNFNAGDYTIFFPDYFEGERYYAGVPASCSGERVKSRTFRRDYS